MVYRSQTVNLAAEGLGSIAIPIPGFRFPTFVGPFSTIDARFTGTQNIFDFSSIRRFQASKVGVAAARADAENTGEQVAAQVARAYLAALKADADVETAQANVTLSEAVLTQTDNQKKAGTGTGIEITRAKVQLANDRQHLLEAQNARRAARLRLLRAIGLRLDTEVELTDKLAYVPVDAVTLEQAKAQAIESGPTTRRSRSGNPPRGSRRAPPNWSGCPSLAAFGDYGSIGTGLNGSLLPTRTVGISVRVPMFDGGRRDARRAESESQYRAEKVRTNDLKEQIELDVRLALDALQSAEDEVKVAQEGLDAGRQRTDPGAPALRRRRGQQHRSDRRADPPGTGSRQSDRGALQVQRGAHRSGAGHGTSEEHSRDDSARVGADIMKKRIVLILVLVAAAGAAIWAYRGTNRPPSNRIVVSGNIELTEVNIAFKTAGRLIERTVDEGDAVKKGQVIARLDRDQLSAQRERETAGLASSNDQLAQARTSLEWQRATTGRGYRTPARPTWRRPKRAWPS